MAVEKSIIIKDIFASPQLRDRAIALLRCHLWSQPDVDPTMPLPLDDVMWAVAANPTAQQFVIDGMAASENPNMTNGIIDQIPDTDLEYIIVSQAWPRLNPNTDDS